MESVRLLLDSDRLAVDRSRVKREQKKVGEIECERDVMSRITKTTFDFLKLV